MKNYIYINKVRLYAFHGVLPQEQQVGGEYEVSLRVGCDFSRAMLTDDVTDTVSYADLLALVSREMAVKSRLLEHVAGRIVRAVFAEFPTVLSVQLSITKLNPPMGQLTDGAGVEVKVRKNKRIKE